MEKVLIKLGRNWLLLPKEEIDWIEADRNYIRIHTGDKSYLMRQTLSGIEKKLDASRFIRVNRSVIVNADRVTGLRALKYSNYAIVLEGEQSWAWGRRFRHNLDSFLSSQIKV
jgi:two-component system, LytTR family, response regulator